MRGTGAEVEGRIETGAEPVIANEEVVTPVLATAILIILHDRHPRTLLAFPLIYLTPVILLWTDPLRAARPVLRQVSTTIDDQIIPARHHRLTGTLIHLDRWIGTVRLLGETSRPSHPRQREREPAVHLLTAHVARFLPGAHHLANKVKDATEVPPSRTEADFQAVVRRDVALLDGDLLVDGDVIVGVTTAAVLISHHRAGPSHLGEIEKSIHPPTDALVR